MTLQSFIVPTAKKDLATLFLENLTTNHSKRNFSITGKQGSGMQPLVFPFWNEVSGYFPTTLIEYLMMGEQTTVISGSQHTGKTTLMMSLIDEINLKYTICTKEENCDYLRSLYPERNIIPIMNREQLIVEALRRRMAIVSVFSGLEEMTYEFLMQHQQSNFSLFTHYGSTLPNIISSLSNSILKNGMFQRELRAEELVVNLIDFNIHIVRDQKEDISYIERITECVPLNISNRNKDMIYEARNIVELRNGKYETIHPISVARKESIERNLTKEEKEAFRAFIKLHWVDGH